MGDPSGWGIVPLLAGVEDRLGCGGGQGWKGLEGNVDGPASLCGQVDGVAGWSVACALGVGSGRVGVSRGTGHCGHLDRAVLWQLSGTAGPTSHFPRLPLGGLVWICHSHHWWMGTDPEEKDGV